MKKIKTAWIIIGVIILFLLGTIWSNSHVTVDKVTIAHNRLPAAFENFKILQISDLKGKEFGNNQKN